MPIDRPNLRDKHLVPFPSLLHGLHLAHSLGLVYNYHRLDVDHRPDAFLRFRTLGYLQVHCSHALADQWAEGLRCLVLQAQEGTYHCRRSKGGVGSPDWEDFGLQRRLSPPELAAVVERAE